MAIHGGDALADNRVEEYYVTLERNAAQGHEPAQTEERDSSTGPCQIFARTAIFSRNWAANAGLISDRQYNFSAWRDRWEVWKRLQSDFNYSIETALFVMMYYANLRTGIPANQMRNLTPAQVMTTLIGYNGGDLYGRKRMTLYYLIQRWHQDFRS